MHMRGVFEQGAKNKWEQSERMRLEAQCVCVEGGVGLGGKRGNGKGRVI